MNILDGLQAGSSRMGEVAPTNTVFALSLSPSKLDSYRNAYKKYLDATQRLSANRQLSESLRAAAGVSPDQWAKDIQEVATLSWKLDDKGAGHIRRISLFLLRGLRVRRPFRPCGRKLLPHQGQLDAFRKPLRP